MTPISERARNLALDALVFTEILLYWSFALLIMKPAQWCDRRFGTSIFPGLDRAMRRIADL
jgi:hypothetical protein